MGSSGSESRNASRRVQKRRLKLRAEIGADNIHVSAQMDFQNPLAGSIDSIRNWLTERFSEPFARLEREVSELRDDLKQGGARYQRVRNSTESVWRTFHGVETVRTDHGWLAEMGAALEDLATNSTQWLRSPFLWLTPDQFNGLGSVAADLGVTKAFLLDALSGNGFELLGGTSALIGAVGMAGKSTAEKLSYFSGGCLLSAAVSANPLLVAVAAGGIIHACKNAEDERDIYLQAGKGGLVSGTAVLAGTLIGGPAWIGCTAAVLASVAMSRALESPRAALERAKEIVRPAFAVLQSVAPALRALVPA